MRKSDGLARAVCSPETFTMKNHSLFFVRVRSLKTSAASFTPPGALVAACNSACTRAGRGIPLPKRCHIKARPATINVNAAGDAHSERAGPCQAPCAAASVRARSARRLLNDRSQQTSAKTGVKEDAGGRHVRDTPNYDAESRALGGR